MDAMRRNFPQQYGFSECAERGCGQRRCEQAATRLGIALLLLFTVNGASWLRCCGQPAQSSIADSLIPLAQTAPVNTPTLPPVQAIRSAEAAATPPKGRKSSCIFVVESGNWQDTGVPLIQGDQATFNADGTLTLNTPSRGENPQTAEVLPIGIAKRWTDLLRQFPLNTANTGALIGRIGDSSAGIPFLIGGESTLTAATSGHLFLRMNLSSDLTGTGSYKVTMKFAKDVKTPDTAKGESTASAPQTLNAIANLVTPATFASIPRRVGDQQGDLGDMVNFALVGTQEQVLSAFANAGYQQTDKTVQDAVLHGLMDTLEHKDYVDMPMSTLYLFGRPQDFALARGDPLKVAAIRHHLRVWKTDQMVDGKPLWVGSSTHDDGFEKDQRNGEVTHHIDPNIDQERDFILLSFQAAGDFSSAAYVLPDHPFSEGKTATGGSFHSDGRILVMELK